jgi:CRISPR-associated exonuclease Cas4
MFSDSDLLPLSAMQHYIYCIRQCALIHIEQQWTENRFTAEGRLQHKRVDQPTYELRDGIRYEYAVPLRSLQLGLVGKADLIEFHYENKNIKSPIWNLKSLKKVFPVEHKRGRPKPIHCDWVQLCAQALCLEEMLDIEIKDGAIFYGQPRRRQNVEFSESLRTETKQTAQKLHELIDSRKIPQAEYEKKKCQACSLFNICMPKKHQSLSAYLNNVF